MSLSYSLKLDVKVDDERQIAATDCQDRSRAQLMYMALPAGHGPATYQQSLEPTYVAPFHLESYRHLRVTNCNVGSVIVVVVLVQ